MDQLPINRGMETKAPVCVAGEVGDSEVRSLYDAYRAGRGRPIDSSIEAGRQEFLAGLKAHTRSRLARMDLRVTSRCKRCCDEARGTAEAKNDDGARQLLNAARILAGAGSMSDEARLLCRSEIVPAEAYVEYCSGNFHKSRKGVLTSLEIDQRLEEEYGYRQFHAHRLHLLTRLVTLESRISGIRNAMGLAAQVFSYFTGKTESVPVPGRWGSQYKSGLPSGLMRFFGVQLTWGIGEILATPRGDKVKLEAIKALQESGMDECSDGFWRWELLAWLELKSLSTGKLAAYLKRCAAYLGQAAPKVPVLWSAAASDAAAVCASLVNPHSQLFCREVRCDAGTANRVLPACGLSHDIPAAAHTKDSVNLTGSQQ